jgi:hypothetical protein
LYMMLMSGPIIRCGRYAKHEVGQTIIITLKTKPVLVLCVMRFTLVFLFCVFLHVEKCYIIFNFVPTPSPPSNNFANGSRFFNLNVRPTPPPPCYHFTRSDGQLNEKKLDIELFPSIETMFLILFSALLMLLWLDLVKYNCRLISPNTCTNTFYQVSNRCNSLYRNLLLHHLILTYLLIFDFYLIILLPSEFFRVQFLNKGKKALVLKCVRSFHNFAFIVLIGSFKCLTCFYQINFMYLMSYPCELLALWYFTLHLILSSDIHPNPGPTHSSNNFSGGFLSFCNWNLNTLSKDDFYRISLLEAHNVNFNYDIISLELV